MKNVIILTLIAISTLGCSYEEYSGTDISPNLFVKFPEKPVIKQTSNNSTEYSLEYDECYYKVIYQEKAMPDFKSYLNPKLPNITNPTDDQITFYSMLKDRNDLIKKAFIDSTILNYLPEELNFYNLKYYPLKKLFGYSFSYQFNQFRFKGLAALEGGNLLFAIESFPFHPLEESNCSNMINSIQADTVYLMFNESEKNINPITGLPLGGEDVFSPTTGKVRSVYEDYPPSPYSVFDKEINRVFWQLEFQDEVNFHFEDGKAVIKE